jgi:iron complex outermembrane receptor protein
MRGLDLRLLRAGCLGLLCSLPTIGCAQVLEEIVVTAQKREQAIQDVGIAITAFSGEQVRDLGLSSSADIGMHSPGLIVTDNGPAITAFTLRGSGQLDFGDHQEGPVAVYVDGAYMSYLGGVGFKMFDIERVEVLKGPQGTLFGRNATGGVVHIITKRPTPEPEGYAEVTVGERGLFRFDSAVSGPLTDTLSGRASVYFDQANGYMENIVGRDLNDVDNMSGRLQLLFEPNEDLAIRLQGQWTIDDATAQVYKMRRAFTDGIFPDANTGVPRPIVGGVADGLVKFDPSDATYADFCANALFAFAPGPTDCFGDIPADISDDPRTVAADQIGYFKRYIYEGGGDIDWDLGWAKVVSITDFKSFTKKYIEDSDSSPVTRWEFPQQVDSTQFSQELRLEGEGEQYRWTVGAYYLNIDGRFHSGINVINNLGMLIDNRFSLETDTWAVFGQGEYDFSSQWTLLVGVRWTEDDKDFDASPRCYSFVDIAGTPLCTVAFGAFLQDNQPYSLTRSEGDWSGKAELDWKPNDDWLLYVSATRGQKAGGYNGGGSFLFDLTGTEYDGETLAAYEGGFKSTLFGGTTRLNGALFYYDYKDFQTFTQVGPALFVFNVDAEVLGGELELVTNPWEGWEFLLGLSLLDATQKDLTFFGTTRDRDMPNAPEATVNGLGRYEWAMFGGTMAAQIDFRYVDTRQINAVDHPALIDSSYWLANGRVFWNSENNHWGVTFFVNNMLDTDYVPTAFDTTTFTGNVEQVINPPRWFGGSVRYSWD